MKTFMIVLGTIALAVVLVAAGLWLGVTWIQARWGYGMMGGYGGGYGMMDSGMMGGWGYGGPQGYQGYGMMGPWGDTYPEGTETLTIDEAKTAVERALKAWNYDDLMVTEVMEFSNHFYAEVEEKSTGIGAFEVLVDKVTGGVYPEPGPNMMWNLKYGMMGGYGMGMMGGGGMMGRGARPAPSPVMPVDEAEAIELAQKYLDTVRLGSTANEEADAFYGYYTLHVLTGSKVTGMLSVNGYTGQVWYHTWHGAFVAMTEVSV
jgi:hypothetical protein